MCHRYVQSAVRQGTLAWGRTRALQKVSSTSLSWPWSNCMQATTCVAVPRPQLAEHGPRDSTFHLQEEEIPMTATRAFVCGTVGRPSAPAAMVCTVSGRGSPLTSLWSFSIALVLVLLLGPVLLWDPWETRQWDELG